MPASFGRADLAATSPNFLTEADALVGYVPIQRAATAGALPTAAVAYRGTLAVVESTAGVTDAVYVCLKSAADTYAWRPLTTGG